MLGTGMNMVLDYQVLTTKGPKWTNDLHIGDMVYEYGTDERLMVTGRRTPEIGDIFQVDYSDGRHMLVNAGDLIYIGTKGVRSITHFFSMSTGGYALFHGKIDHPPVHYAVPVGRKVEVDPYSTGALWFGGDWEDMYLNMRMDMDEANGVLAHQYSIEYAEKLGRNKVYFRHPWEDTPLTWNDFFSDERFANWYPISRRVDAEIIPHVYEYGDIRDRRQFLMGVFDVGWRKDDPYSNQLELIHSSEGRLQALQKLMWSLGILSKIVRERLTSEHDTEKYRLIVLDDFRRYPFLYKTEKIEAMLQQDQLIDRLPPFEFYINEIHRPSGPAPMDRGAVPYVKLEKKDAVFFDANFLPRVSHA